MLAAGQAALLRVAVTSHRSATQLGSHQAEWKQQQSRLHSQRQRAEDELQSAMTALALNSYDANFDSSATDIHSLHRDVQLSLDESKAREKDREEWAQLMRGPRTKAHQLIDDVRRLRQAGGKETRLRTQQREDELKSTQALLRSLMHGLRHQSAAFADELHEQEKALQEELKHCTAQWLERMADDGDSLSAAVMDEGVEAALPVNPHWLTALPSDQRAEVDAERHRWSAVLAERLDMEDRRHSHRLEQLQADWRQATAGITVQRQAEWAEEESEEETKQNGGELAEDAERKRGAASTVAAARRPAAASKLKVKGQRMASPRAWSAADERRLRYLWREYTAAGKQRKQLMDRLVVDFPTFPLDELRQRVELVVNQRFHVEQRNIECAQHKQHREDIAQAVLASWSTAINGLKAEWRRREERQHRDAELQEKRAELEEQRIVHEQRQRALAEEAEVARLAAAEADAVRAEEEKRRREVEHRQLLDYEAAQALEAEKVQRLVDAEQRRLALEKDEDAQYHAQRVAVRQQQTQAKLAAQRQAEAEQRAERHQHEAAMQALAETLAPVVAASTERLMAPTASSAAEGEGAAALFRVDGYSSDGVFNDPRAKLSAALYAAGIAPGHEYAREVLEKTGAGAKQMRKDLQSSVTFGADAET